MSDDLVERVAKAISDEMAFPTDPKEIARAAIDAVRSAAFAISPDPTPWISVQDRLPTRDDGLFVLCWVPDEDSLTDCVDLLTYEDNLYRLDENDEYTNELVRDAGFYSDEGHGPVTVTHWMPTSRIPAPKEAKK